LKSSTPGFTHFSLGFFKLTRVWEVVAGKEQETNHVAYRVHCSLTEFQSLRSILLVQIAYRMRARCRAPQTSIPWRVTLV
jgi:hypothetical protein